MQIIINSTISTICPRQPAVAICHRVENGGTISVPLTGSLAIRGSQIFTIGRYRQDTREFAL